MITEQQLEIMRNLSADNNGTMLAQVIRDLCDEIKTLGKVIDELLVLDEVKSGGE